MKTLTFVSALLLLTVSSLSAQNPIVAKNEFLISLSSDKLEIKPGETKELTVSLIRSKSFSKGKASLGFSSSLPAGLALTYEPVNNSIDQSTARIVASADMKPGTYIIVLKGTINNKDKGTTLKLVVGDGPVISNVN
jgi:hypothetical protein